jgi:hypothetical protein
MPPHPSLLAAHFSGRRVVAPIGMAQIRAAGDDGRAQVLIAHQRQKRTVNNRTSLGRAFALRSVTSGAKGCVSARPPLRVARFLLRRRGAGWRQAFHWLGPTRSHLMHQNFDLLIRQRSARAFAKAGMSEPRTPEVMARRIVVTRDGQINRIRQAEGRVAFAVRRRGSPRSSDCKARRSRAPPPA